MAVVHQTTMNPGKLDLLTEWLPRQHWYLGADRAPVLVKGGGFRLDDPEGEVGIEFMVVVDTAGPDPVAYLVPMSYRGAPNGTGPEAGLIGTSEHGVLGTRWIYDGTADPVLMMELAALLAGRAVPQQQNGSDAADPTVTVHPATGDSFDYEVIRVLHPLEGEGAPGQVVAGWVRPDGTAVRGVFATALP
ncbi:hypothetical protein F4556_000173 [Kitasatospora gansuensis]|uniref:Maltokinase N-terminal cap domain-containing protein n=1 Tax=Kitasatospora gansuensis TaxID=258050 RepID=A0A7W7WF68_9ACTN|nr:1,4-alpha-glucan branching protein [Kitasatospora gansuensis]MBB4944638.1 hypothetical protein [Kitasatospora gansuensis]